MTCDEQKQINLEDILITEELSRRLPKTIDLQAENQALHTLARQLAESPQIMLKTLVAVARDLCQAGTAGVSLLEITPTGEEIFRWVALAGELEEYEQGTSPGDFSPCGVCLERRSPQLFLYPERYFTYFQQAKPAIIESLIIPLAIDEQPLGTIWIVSHDEQRHFDSEDVRLMTSLANFTAAALGSSRARQTAVDAQQALHESQAQMQSLLANIPGMVYRYIAGADGSDRFAFVNSGCRDLFEVESSAALQDANLIWNQIHPDDQPSFQASAAKAAENFLPWDWQGRIITSSGKLKWIQGRSSGLRTADGDAWDGWLIDITDRKQIEEALRESEELKQRILDSSNDWIKVLRLDGHLLYLNPGGQHLLEVDDSASILNSDWVSFWQGEDYDKALAAIAAARMGNTGQFQGYLPTAKGKPKWWDTIISPIRDASGQVVQLLAISRDISTAKRLEAERQQAEMALREAHVQLESALAAGSVYTWRWKIFTDRVVVNAAFAHLFAVDPAIATTVGLPIELFIDAIHEEDRDSVSTAINQAISSGKGYAAQYRVRTASGGERWLSACGRVEYDAAGNPVSFPGALIDITYLKLAEDALRLSEERYRTLFESIDDGFCIIEMLFDENNTPIDYRFLQTNPAFEKQTGLVQAVGKTARQLVPNLEAHWYEIYGKVALTGEPIRFENASQVMNRWFEVYACRIGEPPSRKVAVLFKDITERKRIEAEREQILQREQTAREAAETANRIKDEFLAVLSHELRSPLNPILGWSSMLRNGKLNAAKTAYALETIERNAKLQVQLIEDLLDVSRILRGKLSLNMAPINLASTITAAMETVQLAAQAKSIRVETVFEKDIGQILGDSARLQQIIWNLLTNAVKFTPNGGNVEIQLNRIGSQAQIQVRDTGKGITPDFLPHVFEYFRQADSTTTRTFGGLGLGLAIVRHLVELHGGTVHADSPGVGQGATFTVRLPLLNDQGFGHLDESTSSSLIQNSSSLPLANLRVLLVDDDTDTRDLITFILEQSGALVTSATSAIEALETFKQTNFDVLISDIGMPQMDGYMLMRQIRAITSTQGRDVLAVALTAYAGEINQEQANRAGFQRHITKPIEPEELVKVIVDLIKASK
ncbi:PAS domain S-box protein [Brasilonema octagenarum]|uniref:histidine kinase n=1 Tax=Brasilonema octagenarum UFV-OR1 TaxID=417115 RepID=A0ABX1ME39_9CYAN|nr:PAS domain S-box protein [Brasilonema octagenarum]NMF65385.1 hybrid sensor histidine kinase/response regulator [Brasilonema octagenarum UFV-OR1]